MSTIRVAILRGRVAICKTIRNSTKEPYPLIHDFKSTSHTISTLEQFATLIKQAAAEGACLLKGELDRELDWESRAGHTNPNKSTSWICLDLDYLKSITTVDEFLQKSNATEVSYILQWSASYGIHGNFALKCHLFMLLDQPYSPAVLKEWLRQVNLQTFSSDMGLVRGGCALRWPLDITTCQNDKLLFVAPPICHPTSINHFQGERVVLVKKSRDTFALPTNLLTVEQVKALEHAKINELRKAAGMDPRPARAFVMKDFKGQPYLPKPDQATVSSTKEERGFVYLNLNGGDSFAYYHPKDNPTFIFNFKGEPTYLTKELIPEYWYQQQREVVQAKQQKNKGKLFLGFRDLRTGFYYNGWFDEDTEVLELFPARSERQINDFLTNHGQPVPDSIPTWNVVFDPHTGPIDLPTQTVNLFRLSKYMKEAVTRQDHQPFPTIDRLCRHVVGEECLRQWYNWLAYVYQQRTAPRTAWVWHGVPGIGKGVLFNDVLTPLFGTENVVPKRMEELEDRFNTHLENCLLCFVDEAQVSDSGRSRIIMANLKNQITEPLITIRQMHKTAYTITNRVGWIFASNMPDAVVIATNDRRFNVGEFQAKPIVLTDADFEAMAAELQDFAVFLRLYEVDEVMVRNPIQNSARQQLIMISMPSADLVAQALNEGHLHQLWDALPSGEPVWTNHREEDAYQNYKKLLHAIVNESPLRDRLTREELHTIFNFCVGNIPSQPWKLTSYLKHHGIEIKDMRANGRQCKGILVAWKDDPEWVQERKREIYQAEHPNLKVVK